MAKKTKVFKSKDRKSRTEVSAFLHQLADRISSGRLMLRQGKEEVTLELPNSMILEIDVEDQVKKVKGLEHTIEIEITWFENDKGGPLVIE